MKKKIVSVLMIGTLVMSMAACGAAAEPAASLGESNETAASDVSVAESTSEVVEIANPWADSTEEEANSVAPNLFRAPEGATNLKWSIANKDADGTDGNWPMVQLTFDLDGNSFTAREQVSGDNFEDISGMYYDWTVQDDVTLANWGGGNMTGKAYRYVGEDKYVDVINWYDVEIGISYSLSTEAKDLDGFDIQAIAEAMYDESKQYGSDIPDDEGPVFLDITGCNTFTDIVNKLDKGWAYANANIGGTDVLLVSDYNYDYDGNGKFTTIDSRVYCYDKDGIPVYLGYVSAGGTAYPLTIADGELYVCGNHFAMKYTIVDNALIIDENAWEDFDTSGNATYYYWSATKTVETDENGQVPDDTVIKKIFEEYMNGEMVYYSVVG